MNALRILAVSDSHGDTSALRCAFDAEPSAKYAFFLGDGALDMEDAIALYSQKIICKAVRGNCDFVSDFPDFDTVSVENVKIYMTHGHREQVKLGLSELISKAKGQGAKIALFGHTHMQVYEYINGLHLFNPGSVREGRYGVVDITPAGIVCVEKRLRF